MQAQVQAQVQARVQEVEARVALEREQMQHGLIAYLESLQATLGVSLPPGVSLPQPSQFFPAAPTPVTPQVTYLLLYISFSFLTKLET